MQIAKPETNTNQFLDEVQLAERWRISRRTLQQSRWKGIGCNYTKIGRLVRYSVADVEQYESLQRRILARAEN